MSIIFFILFYSADPGTAGNAGWRENRNGEGYSCSEPKGWMIEDIGGGQSGSRTGHGGKESRRDRRRSAVKSDGKPWV